MEVVDAPELRVAQLDPLFERPAEDLGVIDRLLPDLKPLGGAELGGKGAAWVTLTPDGKTAYVANPVTNDVSVIDIKSLKEVTRIPVGFVPKRNTTGLLP